MKCIKVVIKLVIILLIFLFIYSKYNKQEIKRYTYINTIEDRYLKKYKDYILIGNNDNELDNGYYDIKIESNIIYINKLYINYDKDKIIDYKYLNNMLMYLNGLYNEDILNYTYEDIINYYNDLRKNNDLKVEKELKKVKLNSFEIIYSYYDNMLKIELKKYEK